MPEIRWCHNGWASSGLMAVDTGYAGIHHWQNIGCPSIMTPSKMGKKKKKKVDSLTCPLSTKISHMVEAHLRSISFQWKYLKRYLYAFFGEYVILWCFTIVAKALWYRTFCQLDCSLIWNFYRIYHSSHSSTCAHYVTQTKLCKFMLAVTPHFVSAIMLKYFG